MNTDIFIYVLIGLSLIFTCLGGIMDMLEKDRLVGISKQHFWNDGIYLLVLAIVIKIIKIKLKEG